jgi:hypothetical protein
MSNLFDLIGLGLGTFRLKVQDFFHSVLPKNVVAALDTLAKAEAKQHAAQVGKSDV